jgi:hypothetical protein
VRLVVFLLVMVRSCVWLFVVGCSEMRLVMVAHSWLRSMWLVVTGYVPPTVVCGWL